VGPPLALLAAALEAIVRLACAETIGRAHRDGGRDLAPRRRGRAVLALGATLLTALACGGGGVAARRPATGSTSTRASASPTAPGSARSSRLLVLVYPVVLVLFAHHASTGFMGFVVGLVAIVLYTREGLAAVSPTLVRVGRAFNLTPRQEFWKILLPAGTPMIFTGLRLGTIYALVNIIGVEYLINFGGLGFVVSETYDKFDTPGMYGAIVFVILVSGGMLWLLKRVQTWLRPAERVATRRQPAALAGLLAVWKRSGRRPFPEALPASAVAAAAAREIASLVPRHLARRSARAGGFVSAIPGAAFGPAMGARCILAPPPILHRGAATTPKIVFLPIDACRRHRARPGGARRYLGLLRW
jgi:ABC-type proline/glycine betaine transport system permease subunit